MLNSQVMDWEQRLALIVANMREMSSQTDPQEMVRVYAERFSGYLAMDGMVAVSRRGLSFPQYRITRSHLWGRNFNPWEMHDKLPLMSGGLLGELLYGDEPNIIDDFQLAGDDPAHEHLTGHRTIVAVPHFNGGEATNMVFHLNKQPAAFDRNELPELVWLSNLFGRATQNLVLSNELQKAYEALDHELEAVGHIQHSLLPSAVPDIGGLSIATHYATSRRAGGDYYDFFPLSDGTWGIFIADVSGHGTPAAVVMAMTHTIAHSYPGEPHPPAGVMTYVNRKLAESYTALTGTFVTAFYGIWNPADRCFTYCCAGHNPPRVKSVDGKISALDQSRSLPLGILANEEYHEAQTHFAAGDTIIFYTDGITESFDAAGEMFGVDRLDEVLRKSNGTADELLGQLLERLNAFTGGAAAKDDRTLLVTKVE